MRITKRQLKRIILEALGEADFLKSAKESLKSGDLESFAALLVDEYGQEAYLFLEDMKFEDPDWMDVRDLVRDPAVESAVYDEQNSRTDAAIAASPNKKVLIALGDVFAATVSDDNVKHIVYQPRRKGGQVSSLALEDIDGKLGHMTTSLNANDAKQAGTTLQAVMDVLEKGGATLRKKRPPVKHVPPMYD